ncbi:Ribosome-binding protein 1 [Cytospora mali]|uniref:Ribosome-binding protein 1 n=1 Tax=Cytospora mali TaxID=578113 RepID=A0A194W8E0_CYTMA|nr:Ribosome-binding protein 1 [Valsa mali]
MDEALPVTVVPPFDELGNPELTTTELETPEDGTDGDEDSEGLDNVEMKVDDGKFPHDVVLLAPLERPGVDDPGVLLRAEDRELLDPVDTLSRLLITVKDGLIVIVVALVVVRTVISEVKSFVVMVEISLLLIVVSKVDGEIPLLDTDNDGTTKFEDELRVNVSNIVVVKSVICVVERFVAMVVTRLVVIVVGKLMLAVMLLELSIGREELGPEEDGTDEPGTVEEAVPEDDIPEDGASDDDTPEEGTPEEGTPEEDTPEEGTPEDDTPEDGATEDGTPEDGIPDEGTPLELCHLTISTQKSHSMN